MEKTAKSNTNHNPLTMVYISDISPLLSKWKERLKNNHVGIFYSQALRECIKDLEDTLDKAVLHESQSINIKDKQNGQWLKG